MGGFDIIYKKGKEAKKLIAELKGCGKQLKGWTSSFICGTNDLFTGLLILCPKCKQKLKIKEGEELVK